MHARQTGYSQTQRMCEELCMGGFCVGGIGFVCMKAKRGLRL